MTDLQPESLLFKNAPTIVARSTGPEVRSRTGVKTIPIPRHKATPVINPCDDCLPLQEAHHRIANHFALLSSHIRLLASDMARKEEEPDRASVLLLLESIRTDINTVAQVHRALATAGTGASIDVGAHLHGVLTHLASGSFGEIRLKEEWEADCLVRAEQILPLSQIVVEVVTNAIKHSRRGDLAVLISCHKVEKCRLLVEILDNGPGLPTGVAPLKSTGVGMRLLNALASQIGANVGFDSTATGLRFHLLMERMRGPNVEILGCVHQPHVSAL